LLDQVLVALRNSIGRFGEESSSEMLVSIVTSLSKMLAKLPSASRYGLQLFWLAMSLLRLVPPALFNCTGQFLEAVLANISTTGDIRGEKMVPLLLQGRSQLEEAAGPLDSAYGVRFTHENFHFAVCACLARGLTDTVTRSTAMRVLAAFLVMAGTDMLSSPYMALMLARAAGVDELRDGLWSAGINPAVSEGASGVRSLQALGSIKDKDLLLNTTIELVDFQYLEDTVQHRSLRWLDELAVARPAVILHLYVPSPFTQFPGI
jgi:neurofibromin 1